MADSRVKIFQLAKRVLRENPSWTDEQVAADLRVHRFDLDVIREARKDLAADSAPKTNLHQAASWEASP